MHLRRLYIRGFRSIKELDLHFTAGKNVIIGRNNAGKSNIVRALDIVLGESAPAFARSENIVDSDFHQHRSISAEGEVLETSSKDIAIWCELTRDADEALSWKEINKCFGYSFYGRRADGEPHRLSLADLRKQFADIFAVNEELVEKVWVDGKLKNQNRFREHLEPMHNFAYAFRAHRTEAGIHKEIRFLYRESEDHEWILAFKASVRTELLQSAILPAFRDPSTQLRLNQWTWFGKLMRHLTKDCKNDPELQSALSKVQEEGDRIFVGVTAKIENDALSVSFPDAKLSIQFHGDTDAELYKNCGIYIDDGFKSPLVDKGAGIQSATIIGLFSYYVRQVNTTASALLCVEEPELYLHPHARRVISDRLDNFLSENRNQVVITTHGVEFLRTSTDTFNLLLVRKDKSGATTAQAIDARAFLDLLINNNQNELFFADKVILCEGYDEHVIRAAADELAPGELDRQNVSIISVDGKDRIVRMAEVVLKLGIQCYLVADFDFLLRDSTRQLGVEAKPHKSVEHLPDSFFTQRHVTAAEKPLRKGDVAKLRNKLRYSYRDSFYTAKHVSEIPFEPLPRYLAVFHNAGICLLEGELEHLSKDTEWVNPSNKKLNLERVYELRERLSAGQTASELFDLTPFAALLGVVLAKGS